MFLNPQSEGVPGEKNPIQKEKNNRSEIWQPKGVKGVQITSKLKKREKILQDNPGTGTRKNKNLR